MPTIASVAIAVAVPLVVVAFWPLYLSRPFGEVDSYTHFHALIGTLWFVLLIVQPLAVRYRMFALHRVVGRCTYVLAPLFVIAGVLLSHYRLTSMSEETFAAEGFGHYLPFYASVVFAVAYLLGILYRRMPHVHGRFMLLTAMPLVDPVVGRVMFFYLPALPNPFLYQAVTFGLATVFAAAIVFSFRPQTAGGRSARRALIGYFVFYLAMEIGWFTVALTPQWLQLVAAFRSLPLP